MNCFSYTVSLRLKNRQLGSKIKVGAVSYLNTKPLLYGIENSPVFNDIELVTNYPSELAKMLSSGEVDVALLPVAAIPTIENAEIIGDYGIAADAKVASVALFSQVPIDNIEKVYLDYQSRTSVKLTEVLFGDYWKKDVEFISAPEDYIDKINGNIAGVIIGDRALSQLERFAHIYDLSEVWKEYTGLPFVFAVWVANKKLPYEFVKAFNEANAHGVEHIDIVAKQNRFSDFNLNEYYTKYIHYKIDEEKKRGMNKFLELINTF